MDPIAGSLLRTSVAASLALLVMALWLPAARASSSAQDTSAVSLILVRQGPWRRAPSEPLAISLRVTNEGPTTLDGFKITLTTGERIINRSDLEESFADPDSFFEASSFTAVANGGRLPADESRTLEIQDNVSRLDSLARAEEGGVYPLAIRLFDLAGEELDAISTPLIYYPRKIDTSLGVVLVLPLAPGPARAPDGAFPVDPATGKVPLQSAIAPGGWLREVVGALAEDTRPRLGLGLAPSPRLVEELADMADGFTRSLEGETTDVAADAPGPLAAQRLLARLREVLGAPSTQPLFVPYSTPDLPAITENLSVADNLRGQFEQGLAALVSGLGANAVDRFRTDWLFPPGGRLDEPSVQALRDVDPNDDPFKTFFASDALIEPDDPSSAGCPESSPSFTCPVLTRGDEALGGFVSDRGLQRQFAALSHPGQDASDLQRLLAETAMIREELPGVQGRVVQATIPAVWRPVGATFERLVDGLSRAPWLDTLSPQRALVRSVQPAVRTLVESAPPVTGEPGDDLYDAIEQANGLLERFSAIGPPSQLAQRLLRNALAAQSRAWWTDPAGAGGALKYATETASTAEAHLRNITIGGRDVVTLTSRRQPIPLVVLNSNSYPVHVWVHLTASPSQLGLEDDTLDVRRMNEGNNPLTVEATAHSSGSFPLRICVTAPHESCDEEFIARRDITVSSTEFNRIALGITFGALTFLFAFYAIRALRRRRHTPQDTHGAATA